MFTKTAAGAIENKRLLKLSGDGVAHNTATSTDDPVGISDYAVESEEDVAVKSLNETEPIEVTAAGSFSAGADLYAAADGKVQGLPSTNGTYRRVGKADEAATADGDIVRMIPMNDGKTTTV